MNMTSNEDKHALEILFNLQALKDDFLQMAVEVDINDYSAFDEAFDTAEAKLRDAYRYFEENLCAKDAPLSQVKGKVALAKSFVQSAETGVDGIAAAKKVVDVAVLILNNKGVSNTDQQPSNDLPVKEKAPHRGAFLKLVK
tara:strand:+ start:248 stop:670 length:423 start_codon:yes stop_codon:yes gene_type:complete